MLGGGICAWPGEQVLCVCACASVYVQCVYACMCAYVCCVYVCVLCVCVCVHVYTRHTTVISCRQIETVHGLQTGSRSIKRTFRQIEAVQG